MANLALISCLLLLLEQQTQPISVSSCPESTIFSGRRGAKKRFRRIQSKLSDDVRRLEEHRWTLISDLLVDRPQIPKLVETSKGLDQQVSENEGDGGIFKLSLKNLSVIFFWFLKSLFYHTLDWLWKDKNVSNVEFLFVFLWSSRQRVATTTGRKCGRKIVRKKIGKITNLVGKSSQKQQNLATQKLPKDNTVLFRGEKNPRNWKFDFFFPLSVSTVWVSQCICGSTVWHTRTAVEYSAHQNFKKKNRGLKFGRGGNERGSLSECANNGDECEPVHARKKTSFIR